MKLKVQGTEVSSLLFNYLIDFCVIFFLRIFSIFFLFSSSCCSALRKKEHFSCFRLKARTVKINRFWLDFNFKEIVFWPCWKGFDWVQVGWDDGRQGWSFCGLCGYVFGSLDESLLVQLSSFVRILFFFSIFLKGLVFLVYYFN